MVGHLSGLPHIHVASWLTAHIKLFHGSAYLPDKLHQESHHEFVQQSQFGSTGSQRGFAPRIDGKEDEAEDQKKDAANLTATHDCLPP